MSTTPRIDSLLIKPASAVCNLDCTYCFYLDRDADPYKDLPGRLMTLDTLERLVDTYLFYSYPTATFAFQGGEPTLAGLPSSRNWSSFSSTTGATASPSPTLQTNGVLLDKHWCQLFQRYNLLIGVSLDGPEEVNDLYRVNKGGRAPGRR